MKREMLLLVCLLVATAGVSGAAGQQVVYYGSDHALGAGLADDSAAGARVAGAAVRDVYPGGPAANAGLEPGDVIVSVNGGAVNGVAALRASLRRLGAGRVATVAILRNGRPQSLQVRLAPPAPPQAPMAPLPPMPPMPPIHIPPIHVTIPEIHIPPIPPMPAGMENLLGMSPNQTLSLGMSVETMPPQLAQYFGVKAGEQAVLVRSVSQGSVAAKAGLRAGDVILRLGSQPVRSVNDFWTQLHRQRGQGVAVGVLRHGRPLSLKITSVPQGAGTLWPDQADLQSSMAAAQQAMKAAQRQMDSREFRRQMAQLRSEVQRQAELLRRYAEMLRRQEAERQWKLQHTPQ